MTTFREGAEWMREQAARAAEDCAHQYDADLPQVGDKYFKEGGMAAAACIRALPIPQPEAQGETHQADLWTAVRLMAEGSDWKRDSGETLTAWTQRTLAAAKRGVVGEPLAYMNKDGQVISAVEYHKDHGAFAWVIEKHWTPVTPLYAAAPQQNAAPQMPRDDEIRLAMGELTADQMRTAKAAIRWVLSRRWRENRSTVSRPLKGNDEPLPLTQACARAMGYTIRTARADGIWTEETGHYDPLHDDAQAMALVKKIGMTIGRHVDGRWFVQVMDPHLIGTSFNGIVVNNDLNRAICECVAKMQAAKVAA